MARLPRLVVPHQLHHVIQQAVDGLEVFRDDADHQAFLGWLREAARQCKVAVHAYALLPDRVHLLVTPADEAGLGRMMQWIGRQYVPYFNQKYRRSGTLWQGRYKAGLIEAENHFIAVCKLIEYLPVNLGLCGTPAAYRWSSCAHHIGMKADPVITDHAVYWGLGNTPFDREASYRQLLEHALPVEDMLAMTAAAQKGWAFGSLPFKTRIEKEIHRRVAPVKRGRPLKIIKSAAK